MNVLDRWSALLDISPVVLTVCLLLLAVIAAAVASGLFGKSE